MSGAVVILVCVFSLNNYLTGVTPSFTNNSTLQTSLLRSKRSPWEWPTWKDVEKAAQSVGDAVKSVDFGKIGSEIENAGKKVLVEVKKPLQSLQQPPELIPIEEYLRLQEEKESRNRTEPRDDPCVVPPENMPNFSAPGLRLSDIKCAEHSWRVERIKYLYERERACAREYEKRGLYYVTSGENANPGEFPHMVAIGWKASSDTGGGAWLFKCGGSLISPTFVLTAGHCIRASTRDTSLAQPEPSIVRLGDKNIIDKVPDGATPVDKNIIRRIPHPQYASPKMYYDVALFELESAPKLTLQVHPACLWTKPDYSGTHMKAIVTGWGVIQSGGRVQSPELQKATVDLLETPTCAPLMRNLHNRLWGGFQQHQLCAGVLAGGPDTCQGDSGGPLQVKKSEGVYWVVGVTSFGYQCGRANRPGVYSRVFSFLDWLEGVVWP